MDYRRDYACKDCQACRERHIKCVREDTSEKCQKCSEHGRACFQTARHRFRPVTSVNLKTNDDRTIKQNLTYNSSHRWVDIPSQIEFVEGNHEDSSADLPPSSKADQHAQEPRSPDGLAEDVEEELSLERTMIVRDFRFPSLPENDSVLPQDASGSGQVHFSPEQAINSISLESPLRLSKRGRDLSLSPSLLNTTSPAILLRPSWPFTSRHEARLFHHYVRELSPWPDACDSFAHFGKEVPRRVPYYPIIANAIYALSSRHMNMLANKPDDESPHYAEKCVQMLIKSMDDPFAHWDENLLVAVVLLRLHEEFAQDDDPRCHLFGTRKILDSVSAFAADGGLREAASWVSLRQHIFVSLTAQQPLGINLQNFRHSTVFFETSQTNEDWANRMVFIFATILDYAFAPPERGDDVTPRPERWHELRAEVDNWYDTKPWDFAPLWSDMNPETRLIVVTPASIPGTTTTPQEPPPARVSRSANVATYPLKPWPELLLAHRSQVTGLQYYHLARVVLAIYDPELTRIGFGSLRARKASEKTVLDGVKNIVGLSASNENVNNAMFEASHILKACGGYIRDEGEQNAAVAFLERVQQKMGWRTRTTIEELRSQWAQN